ncbi:tetratricopeptide repeat protein, partial [Streptomyces sp. NPDC019890]|uniref:tetratricopeptide repeat protein n=1 Tax=Streptomyces sp. NPDC019890 TaxID=3365064 RepID=UPI00384FA8FD
MTWLDGRWRVRPDERIVGSTVFGHVTMISDVGGDVTVVNSEPQPLYRVEAGVAAPRVFTVEEAREQPSLLLNAQYEQVDFVGRTDPLKSLHDWRDAPRTPISALLLHGPGGQGKSRLAAQFARRSLDDGWTVLQVRPSDDLRFTTVEPPSATGDAGLLLVADYAERWPIQYLITFLNDCTRQSPPVRVLLIARPASSWWYRLAQRIKKLGIPARPLSVPALTSELDPHMLFTSARDKFAGILNAPGTERIPAPTGLDRDEYSTILAVHMAALAAVDSRRRGAHAPQRSAEISAYLLGREYEHWDRLEERGRIKITGEALAQTVFTATLTGALPHAQGLAALSQVQIGTAHHGDQVLKDHAVAYPPHQPKLVLEPLYPDRLGEDFIALMLPGSPLSSLPTDPWATGAFAQLLGDKMEEGSLPGGGVRGQPWARHVLSMLIETAQRWEHVTTGVLTPLLSDHPELLRPASSAALSALTRIASLPLDTLDDFEPRLPWRDAETDVAAAELALRLQDYRLQHAGSDTDRARVHVNLAERLYHAGRLGEALEHIERALRLYEQPVERQGEPLFSLAAGLDLAGILYSLNGHHAKALEASRQAVQHYRLLATSGHPQARGKLSYALANLAARKQGAEDRRKAAQEAVDISRELAEDDSTQDQGELAGALHNLGKALDDMGRHEEALNTLREAANIRRAQVRRDFGPYAPHLPNVLWALADVLAATGHTTQAAQVVDERVERLRQLAQANQAAFGEHFAWAIASRGETHRLMGRYNDALADFDRAIELDPD